MNWVRDSLVLSSRSFFFLSLCFPSLRPEGGRCLLFVSVGGARATRDCLGVDLSTPWEPRSSSLSILTSRETSGVLIPEFSSLPPSWKCDLGNNTRFLDSRVERCSTREESVVPANGVQWQRKLWSWEVCGEKDGAMAVAAGPRWPRTLLFDGKYSSGTTFGAKNLLRPVLDGFPLILVLVGIAQVAGFGMGKNAHSMVIFLPVGKVMRFFFLFSLFFWSLACCSNVY